MSIHHNYVYFGYNFDYATVLSLHVLTMVALQGAAVLIIGLLKIKNK